MHRLVYFTFILVAASTQVFCDAVNEIKEIKKILTLQKRGQIGAVKREVEKFIEKNKESPFALHLQNIEDEDVEPVLREFENLDSGFAYFEEKKWQEVKNAFNAHLEKYPSSPFRHYALWMIYTFSSRLHEEDKENLARKMELIKDLENVLKEPALLPHKMRADALLELSKTLYELKEFKRAKELLFTITNIHYDDEKVYDAHFLLAKIELETFSDPEFFALHAAKALEKKSEYASELASPLIQTYASFFEHTEDEQAKKVFVDKMRKIRDAAGSIEMDENTQLMIARMFVRSGEKTGAKELYEKVLTGNVTPKTEADVLLFSQVLLELGEAEKHVEVLKELRDLQVKKPSDWQKRDETIFFLAKGYEELGIAADALKTYESLDFETCDEKIRDRAKLNLALLGYNQLNSQKRKKPNRVTERAMALLEEINQEVKTTYDPVHFEAAIEYGKIKANLEPQSERKKYLHDYLSKKRKEMFTYDALTQDSHAQELKPYLMLIDGYIASLESGFSLSKGNLSLAVEKRESAKKIYRFIIDQASQNPYLAREAKEGINSLKRMN